MRIELVTQPDASSRTLHEFLQDSLGDPAISRVVVVTAWVNHRALSRIVPALRTFRGRPGMAEIILGIDEGGATEQGLRLAAAEFDRSSVFFTSDDRTFHPKLYLASGATKARLLVGSNNLTPGGLFFNFEVALAIELVPTSTGPPEDGVLLRAVEDYIARLYDDTDVCKPLAPSLEEIIRDQTYRVRDEAKPRSRRGTDQIDPDADRDQVQRPRLFGRTSRPSKPRLPPGDPIPPSELGSRGRASRGSGGVGASGGTTTTAPSAPTSAGAPAPASTPVRHRWFRPLDPTAAQHPPNPRSKPTGNLRLTQHDHGIDQTTYFRTELFGSLVWTSNPVARRDRETASVEMEVVVDGRTLGVRTFQVSHADYREAGQGNVTTVLHISPIADELRATNYSERVITIEQAASGSFRLVIDTAETGPFVP